MKIKSSKMGRLVEGRKFITENQVYLLLIFLSLVLNIFYYLNRDYLAIPRIEEFLKESLPYRENISHEKFFKNIGSFFLIRITFLVVFFIFIIGIYFSFSFLISLVKRKFSFFSHNFPQVNWQILDIFRVIIVILFFVNLLRLIEAIIFKIFDINFFVYFIAHAFLLNIFSLGVIFFFVFIKDSSPFSNLGLRLSNFINNFLLGLFHYIGVIPILFLSIFLSIYFTEFFKYKPEPSPLIFFFLYPQPKILVILVSIFVVLIAPIIEEIFFRGFCYPALRNKLGPLRSMILVTFFFALLHMNVIGFLPIFVLGFLLVYIYEKTHSLVSSISIHVLHNGLILYLVFLYRALLIR